MKNYKKEDEIMDLNLKVGNKLFNATKTNIDKILKKLELIYNLNKDNPLLVIIINDSKELNNYIIDYLIKHNIRIYDMGINKTDSLEELNKLLKSEPVCISNIKEYAEFLNEKIYGSRKVEMIPGIYVDKGKEELYEGLNMARDSFFLDKKIKCIFMFDYEEFNIFKIIADDLVDYCIKLDFNSIFYHNDYNLNGYYLNNNFSEIKVITKNKKKE